MPGQLLCTVLNIDLSWVGVMGKIYFIKMSLLKKLLLKNDPII